MIRNYALIIGVAMVTFSCQKEEVKETIETNQKETVYTIPTTYVFVDGEGNSTVDFTGQLQRQAMLSEIISYTKTANSIGNTVDASVLKNMFSNTGFTWADAGSLGLNSTTKQLKDKCASGDVGITNLFESYMDSIEMLSYISDTGYPGQGGVYMNDGQSGGKGPYLMSANGIEYTQFIAKGLMGAVFYNQITAIYLSDSKMNVDNTTAVDTSAGKYYTVMEHHWDEAFGYFTYATDFPNNGTDKYWGEYVNVVDPYLNSNSKIMNAFLKGRAAISNDDLPTRDAQITIIRNELERVCAAAAIHYINDALQDINRPTNRNHFLSEGIAFLDALRYGYNSIEGLSLSGTEIDQLLMAVGKDFNNVSISNLQSVKNALSVQYELNDVKDLL